jgi:peroxiredoxin
MVGVLATVVSLLAAYLGLNLYDWWVPLAEPGLTARDRIETEAAASGNGEHPGPADSAKPDGAGLGLVERCRRFCRERGLLITGNVRVDAEVYLRRQKGEILTGPVMKLLADESFEPKPSQEGPPLGMEPPDFTLTEVSGKRIRLARLMEQGPVVVVFYYGYGCNHCVAQLFGIQEDLARFKELGATVIAISSDKPESTAEKYREYGKFDFLNVSDPDNKVAEAWGCYRPKTKDRDEDRLHGTFVIDPDGKVCWLNRGQEPWVDNRTLLFAIARSAGLVKAKKS